jgi:phospholipid/cholesterol/gamma-HCH transport system ATP-binding protein
MTTALQSERITADGPDNRPIVRLIDVHKRFDDLVVLDGVSLDLRRGETTVIIGESGSGKSVLLKHMVRLLQPDRGEVWFRETRIDQLSERELADIRPMFGFLFQLSALFDSMTVEQNVAFPIVEHTRKRRDEIARIVKEKLAMVGLDGIQHKWPNELSGGQKKRVALARAIALDPDVILYDEPTTGLDPPRADEINELILKLKRELHVTGVVVTHDMASVHKVADRILMLYQGDFIFDGTPGEIMKSKDSRVRFFVEGRCSDEVLKSLQATGTEEREQTE